MAKKESIKDIAKALGVSITTVSFVINGKAKEKRISEELTKKVEDYIEKVGYKPNHLAQSLRSGKSMVLVFMVEDISNPFFSNIARFLEERAYQNNYKIIYCSTDNDIKKTKELINTFKNRNVDGFIITPTEGLVDEINSLLREKFALILFDRLIPGVETDYVIVENEESAYQATDHLIQNGNRNIMLVTLESDQSQMQDRKAGYLRAINSHGLNPIIFEEPFHKTSDAFSGQQIINFINNQQKVDAIFFTTNYLTLEGLQALRKLGKAIPEQIQIISFDDHIVFTLLQPSISAIAQPLQEIADHLMAGILIQLKSEKKIERFQKVLPVKLIERDSTREI